MKFLWNHWPQQMHRTKNRTWYQRCILWVVITTGHGIAFNCPDVSLNISITSCEEGKWLVTAPLTHLIWFNRRRQNNRVAAWFYVFHRCKGSSVMHGCFRLWWKLLVALFRPVSQSVNKWLYVSWWFPTNLIWNVIHTRPPPFCQVSLSQSTGCEIYWPCLSLYGEQGWFGK